VVAAAAPKPTPLRRWPLGSRVTPRRAMNGRGLRRHGGEPTICRRFRSRWEAISFTHRRRCVDRKCDDHGRAFEARQYIEFIDNVCSSAAAAAAIG